jgi:hypothetical protein
MRGMDIYEDVTQRRRYENAIGRVGSLQASGAKWMKDEILL